MSCRTLSRGEKTTGKRKSQVKIYTKTGDKGTTSLFGGRRVPKDDIRIEAYGTVDELNSLIGLCRSMNQSKDVDKILEEIQNDLFTLGADLATPVATRGKSVKRIQADDTLRLEKHIDTIAQMVQPLKTFVLPGGNRTAALLHLARTVCRRAERLAVRLARKETMKNTTVIYLNRLSDLLFMMARWVNSVSNTPETPWHAL